MKIIITMLLLLASIPAAGADPAADVPLNEVQYLNDVRYKLCMSRSAVARAYERALEGLLAVDAPDDARKSYSESLGMAEEQRDLACAQWLVSGGNWFWAGEEARDGLKPCDPEKWTPMSRLNCCQAANVEMASSRLPLAIQLDSLARNDKLSYEASSAFRESANNFVDADNYAQQAVTRACPAEDSLAKVPGVSDFCRGLRLNNAAFDTLAAIDPDGFPEYSAFASKVNVETTCGDGWLYLTSPERLCQKAREGLAKAEKLLAARDRLLSLGGLSAIPPSVATDFAMAGHHFRKAVDQLCE